MPSPVAAPFPLRPLQSLQHDFALIDLSGEIRIIDREQVRQVMDGTRIGEIAFYKRTEGSVVLRRYLEALPVDSNPKETISDFWISPNTHLFIGTAFSPHRLPANILNFWTGPTVTPSPGDWSSIADYLLEVICDGDLVIYENLNSRLAHMIQRPEEKPGVMVVLLGEQGTGKGMFFLLLRALWPKTTLQVSNVDQVVGRFNAALERHFSVCLDEALFSGDKKAMESLKSLITEPRVPIEQKYQPSRTIDSYHRLFAASNSDHFSHIASDDRRFLFLRVSSCRKQNTEYFGRLAKAIADPVVTGAMLYDLQQKDLSNFDVRQRPLTREHASQRIQSLAGFNRYWFELLGLGGGIYEHTEDWEGKPFFTTETFIGGYKEFNKNAGRHNDGVQAQQISASLRKLCPSATARRTNEGRGYDLPELETARREFVRVTGILVDWDSGQARGIAVKEGR